ncbi:3-oxoadipyl-CoA thiolase [Sphingomonas sp. CGMCC 1.13654]|uniref:3-oxoadipyl-CoA thiolase n=1 Tax=Sphingomonas chungangi TaxID=2683589 RepID=A0A838L8M6_9SPHN|nr:3-oxoadipyl-CoA thiolase [Sphingomonas chungangi]MBA2935534.1 3-oxoadipyl-CoA thiolase [Sphingomonas chungangi]MVW57041.1 3-oxoadipyl-CoA thiolase [Sphingomonas chungangi]
MTEAFICDAVRTPIGRYGGILAKVRTDDLGALPAKALLARNPGLDPAAIEEVFYGCANQSGEDNRNVARMSLLLAGLPHTVPGVTLNRLCASGLEAVGAAARAIRGEEMALAIAGGVESMTRAPFVMGKADGAFGRAQKLEDTTMGWRFVNPALDALYGTETMPRTGENVAEDHGISRADQDAFALRSQQRAVAARTNGFFTEEIVPVAVPGKKKGETVEVSVDEHPRADSSIEGLQTLRPLFAGGTVTAGNASGINDGAAAMIVASEAAAKVHGLTPRARILGMASAGVEPRVMGIGPVPATQKLMARLGLTITDFDAVELNEAFASQSLAVLRELSLPDDAPHVNANGGAIALGHPLGMSGARIAMTLVHQLEKTGGRRGLATLCIGVGMGLALAIERI